MSLETEVKTVETAVKAEETTLVAKVKAFLTHPLTTLAVGAVTGFVVRAIL